MNTVPLKENEVSTVTVTIDGKPVERMVFTNGTPVRLQGKPVLILDKHLGKILPKGE